MLQQGTMYNSYTPWYLVILQITNPMFFMTSNGKSFIIAKFLSQMK